jgi:asparagine synthase (glutamine-hydrolysing)
MCGICGIVAPEKNGSAGTIEAMIQQVAHRGPDHSGSHQLGQALFGHTRLSVLDLSAAADQPMISDDGRYMLTYNGEIYNFRSLREELRRDGMQFRSDGDTEVLLKSLIRWGRRAVPRLDGMFAFALWDGETQTLLLARDRLGIKPLYYALTSRGVVFGSEMKSVLTAGERIDESTDPAALAEYMWYGNSLGERCIYRGVRRLLPGTMGTFSRGRWATETYWSVADPAVVSDSLDQATERVRQLLTDSVRAQLVSDVPIGLFLSGGVDSSALAVLAARELGTSLRTYSVGFDFAGGVNELPVARALAAQLGTQHVELRVDGADIIQVIHKLVESHDQPFGDAANIPLFLLCDQLNGATKVILQGDGGDEMFGGYPRYPLLAKLERWQPASGIALDILRVGGALLSPRRRRFLDAIASRDPALRMALLLSQETQREPPTAVLSDAWRERVRDEDPFRRYRELYAMVGHLDPAQAMLRTDAAILLPDIFLEKVDRATMAHGIEVRVPFLGAELVDYAMGVPSSVKVRNGEAKYLLRRALRGIVPDAILDAPKQGFGVPYEHWLRTSLADFMQEVLSDPGTVRSGMFDHTQIAIRMKEHIAGVRDHGFLLWKSLQLALWVQHRERSSQSSLEQHRSIA